MLKKIKKSNLKEILEWRNSLEVRKVMFTDHKITENEHVEWWKKIQADTQKEVLIFSMNDVNLGVVNYFDIDQNNNTCHWGFCLSNQIPQKADKFNIWQQLEKEAIEYSFKNLQCSKLVCESFAFNTPVIEMHKRFGFLETDIIIKKTDEDLVSTDEIFYIKKSKNKLDDFIDKRSIKNNKDLEYLKKLMDR